MRILHILDHSLPLQSGYSYRTRALMRAQMALGWDVAGITGLRHSAAGPDADQVDGILFHRTPGGVAAGGVVAGGRLPWREVRALSRAIARVAADWRPDILHAHSPALTGLAATLAARRLSLPLVYEIRAFWEDAAIGNGAGRSGSLRYRLTRALENLVVRRADAVVPICAGLHGDLVARGVDPARMTMVPNGVDLNLFGAPPRADLALRSALGLIDAEVIGFVGSFYPYEGLDDLIQAFPAVRRQRPNAVLMLVGGGPDEDRLRALAQASPAAHAIRFIGRVPHDQVEAYYALIDLLVYPRKAMRLTELVTPLKPLEAMAQGRLVAASNVGGHRELIDAGRTGWLFPPDQPAAMADCLIALLAAPQTHAAIRAAARAYVTQDRNWAQIVRRYQPVYHRLAR